MIDCTYGSILDVRVHPMFILPLTCRSLCDWLQLTYTQLTGWLCLHHVRCPAPQPFACKLLSRLYGGFYHRNDLYQMRLLCHKNVALIYVRNSFVARRITGCWISFYRSIYCRRSGCRFVSHSFSASVIGRWYVMAGRQWSCSTIVGHVRKCFNLCVWMFLVDAKY